MVLAGLNRFVVVVCGGQQGAGRLGSLVWISCERSGEYTCADPCTRRQLLQAYAQPQLGSTHTKLTARPGL